MSHNRGYSDLLKLVAKNVKHWRKIRNLTQEEMSCFGFNYRHFQKLEQGDYSPSLYTLYRVAKALKIKLTDLFV